ncbi:hypothetical protein [Natronorubrum texcoconense]|uniref:proteasome endopeptidase complex n=1 Tax=Natronorubrum texcoconense TaxID=1095776 RepID=A0A1G8WRG6_9EURY|nr:hypothetical protein [Natronorubrum texcoconense]SDJ80723.1 proteasome endopeptidase complex, beta component Threonine peptidase. MEROPS family T01A [Natronorubrum texcoconense]
MHLNRGGRAADVQQDERELTDAVGGSGAMKTGTTSVGLTARNGVVLATDARATVNGGTFVENRNLRKITKVHPTAAMTLVGHIGPARAFARQLREEADSYEIRHGDPLSIESLATLAGNLVREHEIQNISPLIGGVDENGISVVAVDTAGGVIGEDFVATGSGMQLAYGVLEDRYEDDLSVDTAVRLAAKAVQSGVSRDTQSGDGVFIGTITADGVSIDGHDDFSDV